MDQEWLNESHRRWDPLREQWVIVSPHRTQRPWQGQMESTGPLTGVQYDPTCYLCPGNARANGEHTPRYTSTYVFENDFAALRSDVPKNNLDIESRGLLIAETERGVCRVLCFDPRHDLTLATMSVNAIAQVVAAWTQQTVELAAHGNIQYVQIFENRGAMAGASNPHPHGQIWATEHIPDEPLIELQSQHRYYEAHGRPLLSAYLDLELHEQQRVIAENNDWVALVPFWAVWPFETMLLPRQTVATFAELNHEQASSLAEILRSVTAGYNRVFEAPFPYSMGFHPAPCDGKPHPEWVLHAHFYPPLLRSATVRKFMTGFELLGSAQRDITPESAADTLRRCISLVQGEELR